MHFFSQIYFTIIFFLPLFSFFIEITFLNFHFLGLRETVFPLLVEILVFVIFFHAHSKARAAFNRINNVKKDDDDDL